MSQAEYAHTITTPIVDLTTPRKQVDDALYEAGVITDIIGKLATLMIGSSDQVSGTSFDWLAKQLLERHDAIRELTGTGSFWAGA